MPYPSKVNHDQIIAQAGMLIEQEGFAALSLARLGNLLGIKAASLYKHFADKDAILRAVNLRTVQALIETTLAAVAAEDTAPVKLAKAALSYRQFALSHPATYSLALSRLAPEVKPDPLQLEQLVLPLQALFIPICGEDQSLTAIRGLFALMHGFIISELNDQFQRGGNLDETYRLVVERYLRGWA